MADTRDLEKIAVRVAGIRTPINWDRTLGYEGHARLVVAYWDISADDAFIGDGLTGAIGGAWWVYPNLVESQAALEITAALVACGARDLKDHWPLGDSESEAYMGLILDRFDHELWVAHLDEVMPILLKQHKEFGFNPEFVAAGLVRQRKSLKARQSLTAARTCNCTRGWLPSGRGYVPCPSCRTDE